MSDDENAEYHYHIAKPGDQPMAGIVAGPALRYPGNMPEAIARAILGDGVETWPESMRSMTILNVKSSRLTMQLTTSDGS